jgi:hypothetical protein
VLTGGSASAWVRCDFLTGGGWIIHNSAKANFSIAGSCRPGGNGHGLWGHLQYIDHGTGLNVHWKTITAYSDAGTGTTFDPKTGQPHGIRFICGTARTNRFGDVDWVVRAEDNSEPGVNDVFIIRLSHGDDDPLYTTEGLGSEDDNTLGGTRPGGGDIQLHKQNPSITESFTELNRTTCPAFFATPA